MGPNISDPERILRRVDVADVLDQAGLRGPSLAVFVLTTLALIFDGFDVQAVAFAAPDLLRTWGLQRPALGPVLAMGLLGMALGAFIFSAYADRYGRRWTLIIAMFCVAGGALGCARSGTLSEIIAWRFVTGIGIGVSAPNAIALMVEFTPRRLRNLLVSITLVGVPIGGIVGAALAARLLPEFGWRSVFFAGALLPALVALAMCYWLHESPRFLALHSSKRAALAALLNRIVALPTYSAGDEYTIGHAAGNAARTGVRALLGPSYRRDTLVIWLIFCSNLFAVYVFFGWLPTALSGVGLPLDLALRCSLFFNLGGVAGAVLGALCMNRWGSRPVLIVLAIGALAALCSLSALPLGHAASRPMDGMEMVLLLLMSFTGLTMLGLQVAMYSVAAHAYPTVMRVSGVGWAQGLGRLGGILSSFAGGAFLSLGAGVTTFFLGIACVFIVTLLGVCVLANKIAPNSVGATVS